MYRVWRPMGKGIWYFKVRQGFSTILLVNGGPVLGFYINDHKARNRTHDHKAHKCHEKKYTSMIHILL